MAHSAVGVRGSFRLEGLGRLLRLRNDQLHLAVETSAGNTAVVCKGMVSDASSVLK